MKKQDLSDLIISANNYADSLRISEFEYLFSHSCSKPTLYSSVYACMIKSWTGEINKQEKGEWAEFLNSFQIKDGFYVDMNCMNENYYKTDGWGARHLIPHILIALRRLEAKPVYEFSFINKLRKPDDTIAFLEKLDYKKIWGTSNIIMNYGVTMQYARDYMGAPFNDSIIAMEEWLLKKIRKDCAMWQKRSIKNKQILLETIRGAYHIYPILLYDRIEIPNFWRVIPYILFSQNRYGGFDIDKNSSACDDIDAIDPLVRSSIICGKEKNFLINIALKRARKNVINNRNEDGGFMFKKESCFSYGGEKQLFSEKNESNLFGTWFRLLSLQIIEEFFENDSRSNLMWFPGYELSIKERISKDN